MSYHTHEEMITLFDNLIARHPVEMKKQVIGRTVENRPIPMYKIGNSRGGKFLFDGEIHAGSFVTKEVLYLYAKWLLESGDEIAKRILRENNTLVIPIVNIDRSSGRKNANGVDLNRNFTYNWSSAGSSDPNSDYYRGPSPASEPETQALKKVFETEKPELYINHHNWGGPFMAGHAANDEQRVYSDALAVEYDVIARQMGVNTYAYYKRGLSSGYAVSDAALAGINSWLIELVQTGIGVPPFSEVSSYYFPKWLPIGIAFSQHCGIEIPYIPLWKMALAITFIVTGSSVCIYEEEVKEWAKQLKL